MAKLDQILPIIVTVTDFKLSKPGVYLADADTDVPTCDCGNNHQDPQKPDHVQVKGHNSKVELLFIIRNGIPNSTEVFFPVDISFTPMPSTAAAGSDDVGKNFSSPTYSGCTMMVTDKFYGHGTGSNAHAPAWKVSIDVQRKSDSKVGPIDPVIEN